ncbi:hypothetical protein G6O67_000825 [Ophiocordyceps sinensis]|uniref:Uncharacterized protein n=2 Tax=Ophiocordyceps sinensis TaxID=72228 RepID=A0A8H4Q076_9HYPO|nr:hypothetical protein OCS_02601 [Ophiocordyceps sinensis CO18]KAF4513570.1 hypothetical protein G6O67_000825 [Ophiocordyceps sinensis]
MDPDSMDPRLSDSQIVASFTPKQRDIFQWYTETLNCSIEATLDDRVWSALVREKYPTPEEFEEFGIVIDMWCGRHSRRAERPMPLDEFIRLVQGTRFDDDDSRAEYIWHMEMGNMPFIFLGSSDCGGKSIGYGIRPGAYYLWPNLDARPKDKFVLDRSVLGINFNVTVVFSPSESESPCGRDREGSSSDDSVESTEPDDVNHGHGFTFAQIGALYIFADDWERAKDSGVDNIVGHAWRDTGFGVVVEVSPRAQLGAIWVIWNVYPPHPDDSSERAERVPTLDDNGSLLPDVGRLYDDSQAQFMVAKIADSLEDLKRPRTGFAFEGQVRHECQLVRAKLVGDHQQIMRQHISRSERQAKMFC